MIAEPLTWVLFLVCTCQLIPIAATCYFTFPGIHMGHGAAGWGINCLSACHKLVLSERYFLTHWKGVILSNYTNTIVLTVSFAGWSWCITAGTSERNAVGTCKDWPSVALSSWLRETALLALMFDCWEVFLRNLSNKQSGTTWMIKIELRLQNLRISSQPT